MERSEKSIKPFDFNRVFNFETPVKDDGKAVATIAELQAKLALLADALEEAKHERAEAVRIAREEGVAEGLAQARGERAEAQLAATDALHAAFDDLAAELGGITDSLTRDAAEVSLLAADMLAGHALTIDPGRAFTEALNRALHQTAFGVQLTVTAHPDCQEHFARIVAERQGGNAGEGAAFAGPSIRVVSDPSLAVNDAHIAWAQGGLIVNAAERRAAVMAEFAGLLDGPNRHSASDCTTADDQHFDAAPDASLGAHPHAYTGQAYGTRAELTDPLELAQSPVAEPSLGDAGTPAVPANEI